MKNKVKCIFVGLLIMSLCLFLLAGCKKNNDNAGNNQAPGREMQYQQNIKSGLDELVKDGTITQDQADKIETALSSMGGGFGRRNGNGSRPEGSGSAPERSGSRPDFNGSKPAGNWSSRANGSNSGTGNMRGFSPLSQLVTDGTITQQQADAVMQKIMGGFGRQRSAGASSSAS